MVSCDRVRRGDLPAETGAREVALENSEEKEGCRGCGLQLILSRERAHFSKSRPVPIRTVQTKLECPEMPVASRGQTLGKGRGGGQFWRS